MKSVLDKYVGTTIGLNINRPLHIDAVRLESVTPEYFTVRQEGCDHLHYIPLTNVVRIVESAQGVQIGGIFHQKKSYPIVVKIGHIVEYVPA